VDAPLNGYATSYAGWIWKQAQILSRTRRNPSRAVTKILIRWEMDRYSQLQQLFAFRLFGSARFARTEETMRQEPLIAETLLFTPGAGQYRAAGGL